MGNKEHPWQRLQAKSDWLLAWCELPAGLWGLTHHEAKVIVLDSRLNQAQRRCTLAHELEHVARGPVPVDPVLAAREEAVINRTVARRLVDLAHLTEAVAWSRWRVEVADELWVDVSTLDVRLDCLDAAEEAVIAARLENIHLP